MDVSRQSIRILAAGLATAMAAIYYLIGLGVLNVGTTIDATAGGGPDLWMFGMLAGTAFLLSALLYSFVDRRWVWTLAVVFNVLVFAMYVAVSATRVPAFEVWGIILRVLQVVLIGALAYLAVRAPQARSYRQG